MYTHIRMHVHTQVRTQTHTHTHTAEYLVIVHVHTHTHTRAPPYLVIVHVFHVVLRLLEVLLDARGDGEDVDVVAPHPLQDEEAAHVLQRPHLVEAGHGVDELDGGGGRARARGPDEVQEPTVTRVVDTLLDELPDRRTPMGLRLGPKTEFA
jgi:hypothetical protein